MRKELLSYVMIALAAGFCFGVMYSPAPAGAASKEIIQLQQDVSRLIDAQNALNTSVEQKHAVLKTLLEQSLDSVNKLNTSMGALAQTVQQVQATTGSRLDSMGTQIQAMVDNVDELKSRMGKMNQQMADTQNTLQSIDAKLGGGAAPAGALPQPSAPLGGGGAPPATSPGQAMPPAAATNAASGPPPSADVLYASARRDFDTGKYDLARQEFSDYLKYYPDTDLAGNAEFYQGEISYAQGNYQDAVAAYDRVLLDYPKSFKIAPARLKKAFALLELGQQAAAIRQLREVAQKHPGTDEARRATAKLHELATGKP